MIKPNLFIVGAAKSGTTSLHIYLKQHPDIFMSAEKEPWHFCKDFIEGSLCLYKRRIHRFRYADQDIYLKLFSGAKNCKIVGESSAAYFDSRVAAREIHDFNPASKIIIMLREPVSFLRSFHSQAYLRTYEDVEDFEEALELEESRRYGKNIPPHAEYPEQLFYSEKVKYAKHVKRYMKYFNDKQLCLIIFEEFFKDIENQYKSILGFLKVDQEFTPKFKIHNPNETPRNVWLNRIILHSSIKNFVQRNIPVSLYNKLFVTIGKKVIFKRTPRKPMDSVFKLQLMRRFKPDVEEISELLGINLINKWGYDCL